MDGPRLDSQLRQVRFLFDQLDIGMRFVRTASKVKEPLRTQVLGFADQSFALVKRLSQRAPTTASERKRLERELCILKLVIGAFRQAEPIRAPDAGWR